MPKTGPDKKKIKRIRKILGQNQNGIWIRELARKCKLSKSTTQRYITTYMKNEIEDILKSKSGFVRIIKLKEKKRSN